MVSIEVPTHCSIDDFYNFFKNHACKLRTVCGTIVSDICLVDGNQSWIDVVGSRQQIYFVTPAKCLIKYEVSAMDVQSHSISFRLLTEVFFNSVTLKVIAAVPQNMARWTIDHQMGAPNIPNPQVYLQVLEDITKAVDEYLRKPRSIVAVEITLQNSTGAALYNFFKEKTYELPAVCPSIVKEIKLADGNRSWTDTVGSRKHICFEILANCLNSIKDEVIAINDQTMTITFFVLEGALLCYYHTFMVTFHVTDGQVTDGRTAKWTIEYVKKDQTNPDPDDYLVLLAKVSRAVDAYLQNGINPAQN